MESRVLFTIHYTIIRIAHEYNDIEISLANEISICVSVFPRVFIASHLLSILKTANSVDTPILKNALFIIW